MEAPQFAGTHNNFNFPMPTAPPGAHRHSWTRSTRYSLKNSSVLAIVIYYFMAEAGRNLNVCFLCIDLCVPLAGKFIHFDQGQVRQDGVIYTCNRTLTQYKEMAKKLFFFVNKTFSWWVPNLQNCMPFSFSAHFQTLKKNIMDELCYVCKNVYINIYDMIKN